MTFSSKKTTNNFAALIQPTAVQRVSSLFVPLRVSSIYHILRNTLRSKYTHTHTHNYIFLQNYLKQDGSIIVRICPMQKAATRHSWITKNNLLKNLSKITRS